MTSVEARAGTDPVRPPVAAQRFGVAWRHPTLPRISPIGILESDGVTSTFWYVVGARSIEGFRPLPDFPDLTRLYRADFLFPFFEHRTMDSRRPDFDAYVKALGLGHEATPLDVLARSGGRRRGDKIQMQHEPVIDTDGTTTCTFLVHGIQYAPEASAALEQLQGGEDLHLLPDQANPVNPEALLITTSEGSALGWVPDLLVEYVHAARDTGPLTLRAVRVNSPGLPVHLRLLVRVDGQVPPSYRIFDGPDWQAMAAVLH